MRTTTPYKRRADQVRRALRDHRLDGLLVTGRANVAYLTGFTGTTGLVVLTPEATHLIVDFRYFEQATSQAPGSELVHVDRAFYYEAVRETVRSLGLRRLAFEADELTYADFLALQDHLARQDLVPSRGLVASWREIKDLTEQQAIRRAAAITSAAVNAALATLQVGQRERDLAVEVERHFQRLGAEGLAFDTLVAFGARSALPHPQPSDRPLQEGDWVLIDAGCRVAGYCADMTRTCVFGRTEERQEVVWDAVHQALQAGIAAIAPGVRAGAIDTACRDILRARGFDESFGHPTGHGVGLELHESPSLAPGSEEALEPGMIITVEPGVYLPGWGGCRLEELVLVTATGHEVLTTAQLSLAPLSTLFH